MSNINYNLLYVRSPSGTPKRIGVDADGKKVDTHYTDTLDWSTGRSGGYSRNWGGALLEVQKQVIDLIVATSEKHRLDAHDTAYVLAIARHESGFNPDAANPGSTASGVGQFIDKTGKSYQLNDANRFDAASNVDALVRHYIDNKQLAEQRGQGEEYVYKYHHDGPRLDFGGLGISTSKVMPWVERAELALSGSDGAPTPDIYVVQSGDVLSAIATRHDVTLDDLLKANSQIRNPDLIYPGQQLHLPVGPDDSHVSAALDQRLHTRVDENGFIEAVIEEGLDSYAWADSPGALLSPSVFSAEEFGDDSELLSTPPLGLSQEAQTLGVDDADEIARTYVDEHGFIDVRVGDAPARAAGDPADVHYSGDPDGDTSEVIDVSTGRSVTDPAATAFGNSLLSAYGVYGALQGGDPLALARVGVGLADKFQSAGEVSLEALSAPNAAPSTLGQVGLGLGAALGTIGVLRALENDDVIGALSSGLGAGAQAAHLAGASFAGSLSAVAGPLGMVSAMAPGTRSGRSRAPS